MSAPARTVAFVTVDVFNRHPLRPTPPERQLRVKQRVETGRRNLIALTVTGRAGRFERVAITVSSMAVMHGELTCDPKATI